MELWLSRHVSLPLYHVNTCRLCGAKKSSSEPILSNSRGVFGTAKLPHFLSTLLQSMALEFNLLALPFRFVLTLNEFRIYKLIMSVCHNRNQVWILECVGFSCYNINTSIDMAVFKSCVND